MIKRVYQYRCNNISLLILVKLLSSLYFYTPYMTLFFLARGFNYVQINSIWGIVVFTMFLAEIPAGIFADRFGQHRAVQAAIFFQFIGELLFLFITDYWLLVIDAIIAGIGFAFGSGALEALIYNQLKQENREYEMNKFMGQIQGAGYIGFILSFSFSSLLVPQANQSNISTAIMATVIAVGLGFLITFFLKPGDGYYEEIKDKPSPLKLFTEGATLLRNNRTLQRLVLMSVLTIVFWDYLINLYQPYFQKILVPDFWLGPTLALASLLAFLSARYVHVLERKIGPRWSLLIATLSPGLIYLILFINQIPWVGVLSVVLFRGFNAMKHPLFADYHNRQIESHNRATVLSMINMFAGGYTALMGLLIGAIAERWLTGAFLFSGLVVSASALFIRVDQDLLSGIASLSEDPPTENDTRN